MSDQLVADLFAMCGVWRDTCRAYDPTGDEIYYDHAGGAPGEFPFDNLVYVDFDGERYLQTNVSVDRTTLQERTFGATVANACLTFDRLGPEAPRHVGHSGGPGLIWFVAADCGDPGLRNYCEPDLIRLEGDRRWRNTVLWRDRSIARLLRVEGVRLSQDTAVRHQLDPRPPGPVHGARSQTTHYQRPHKEQDERTV